MTIALTVTRKGDVAVASVEQLFDSAKMVDCKAVSSNTRFLYPAGPSSELTEFVVSETFAAVQAMLATNAAGNVKAVWARLDATAGKAIGTHDLVNPVTGVAIEIPDKSILLDGMAHVTTTFTSATDGATIALGVPTDSAAGLKAAVAISNGANAWDAGKTALIPVGTVATAVGPLTANRKLQAVVAVEALTAGIMDVLVMYTTKPN